MMSDETDAVAKGKSVAAAVQGIEDKAAAVVLTKAEDALGVKLDQAEGQYNRSEGMVAGYKNTQAALVKVRARVDADEDLDGPARIAVGKYLKMTSDTVEVMKQKSDAEVMMGKGVIMGLRAARAVPKGVMDKHMQERVAANLKAAADAAQSAKPNKNVVPIKNGKSKKKPTKKS